MVFYWLTPAPCVQELRKKDKKGGGSFPGTQTRAEEGKLVEEKASGGEHRAEYPVMK
tara:strand:- start:72 stop:242 length:171 start_codon:yes stop_codon:yes gene_type:complete